MQKISYLNLFLIFVKIGAILLGGGYVILPILTNEFVEKRNWISLEELTDYFAISQSLPGIIAANISMLVGNKLLGKRGAVLAALGIVTMPFLSIVILSSILSVMVSNIYVQGIFWGVGVAVVALILLTIREVWQKSNKNSFFYLIFVSSLCFLIFTNASPIKTILVFVVFGVLYKRLTTPKEAR